MTEIYAFKLFSWTDEEKYIVRDHTLHTAFALFCERFGCHLMDFEKN